MNQIALITICLVPSIFFMWFLYKQDKVEKEPINLLLTLFIGGISSCIISSLIIMTLKTYIPFLNDNIYSLNLMQIIIRILFVISMVEELAKFIIGYMIVWKDKNFNYLYDGILYFSYVALGFSTFENIIYQIQFNNYGLLPIFTRSITSIPAHICFGIFSGYLISIAKLESYKKNGKTKKYIILSIIIPIILHFLYNFILLNTNKIFNIIIFIIYLVLLILLSYKIILLVRKNKKEFK